ncbi:post-PEP-CTERM-1 domain-containing protein [Wenzhouxiangella limi]|uniref:Uncharacterized protein n=1 Tax=Wenzhouxiangella limi TaxID=2707351 RepID=A0A845VAF6_9GAMM|nr:hypothetical protein [Wenzhouxiangella limi]NDY94299.1 hypothetical protein [Wenzhouxiangella limi]
MIRFALFGVVLVTAMALAEDESSVSTAPPDTETSIQSRSGMTVHIDPKTGEITGYQAPDPRRLPSERLERTLSRSAAGLQAVTLPDGTVYVDLQGRFGHLQTARVDQSGALEMRCVETIRELVSFVDHLGVRPVAAEDQP